MIFIPLHLPRQRSSSHKTNRNKTNRMSTLKRGFDQVDALEPNVVAADDERKRILKVPGDLNEFTKKKNCLSPDGHLRVSIRTLVRTNFHKYSEKTVAILSSARKVTIFGVRSGKLCGAKVGRDGIRINEYQTSPRDIIEHRELERFLVACTSMKELVMDGCTIKSDRFRKCHYLEPRYGILPSSLRSVELIDTKLVSELGTMLNTLPVSETITRRLTMRVHETSSEDLEFDFRSTAFSRGMDKSLRHIDKQRLFKEIFNGTMIFEIHETQEDTGKTTVHRFNADDVDEFFDDVE